MIHVEADPLDIPHFHALIGEDSMNPRDDRARGGLDLWEGQGELFRFEHR